MHSPLKIREAGASSRAIGSEHGVTPGDLRAIERLVEESHARIVEDRTHKRQGFQDLYKDRAAITAINRGAATFRRQRHENLVILGIGGSALGATALVTALKPAYYNLLSREQRGGYPRIFVMDNIDPSTFNEMLKHCDPAKTLFNVISKSGGTAETLAQLFVVIDVLRQSLGKSKIKNHLVATTGSDSLATPLKRVHKEFGLTTFDVPANVGGRFSIFSSVGLFPAAMLGFDIDALVDGCKTMDKRCSNPDLGKNPAYRRAAYHFIACTQKSKPISVMMPYSDRLRDTAHWYRQIWAESLGKRHPHPQDSGQDGTGQTAITALGVTDQHSQLQLYLEGPNDKIFNVIKVARQNPKIEIPVPPWAPKSLGYMRLKTMNDLLEAERRATVDALKEAKRPVMEIIVPRVNEHTLAQLLYMLEVETAFAGRLFGIDPFDQPAVERIKVLTRTYMGINR